MPGRDRRAGRWVRDMGFVTESGVFQKTVTEKVTQF